MAQRSCSGQVMAYPFSPAAFPTGTSWRKFWYQKSDFNGILVAFKGGAYQEWAEAYSPSHLNTGTQARSSKFRRGVREEYREKYRNWMSSFQEPVFILDSTSCICFGNRKAHGNGSFQGKVSKCQKLNLTDSQQKTDGRFKTGWPGEGSFAKAWVERAQPLLQ